MRSPFVRRLWRRTTALALVIGVLSAHRGHAQVCDRQLPPANYRLKQGNDWNTTLSMHPTIGNNIGGRAHTDWRLGGTDPGVDGNVDGTFIGNKLVFRIYWDGDQVGMYDLAIDETGQMAGATWEFKTPEKRMVVIGEGRVLCKPIPPSFAAPPQPKSLTMHGVVRAQGTDRSVIVNSTAGHCVAAYVWREAIPSDHVCVTQDAQQRTVRENQAAASLWMKTPPGSRACVAGYVWREAYSGDNVCVSPATRDIVRQENREAPSHAAK